MTVLATLDAAGLELVLRVEGYEFPQFDSGWDANWLVCDVGSTSDFWTASTPIIARRSWPLSSSASGISCEFSTRSSPGTAALEHPEEQVGLTVRMSAGKGTVEGFLADSAAGRLSFENIEIDQSCVRLWLEQFDEILEAFPVRGGLHE